jgi:hypothetical protein
VHFTGRTAATAYDSLRSEAVVIVLGIEVKRLAIEFAEEEQLDEIIARTQRAS